MRITSDEISQLEKGQIFVFGSNRAGKHGKGAARTALKWGAIWGQAEGLQGRTYGIPTKDKDVIRILSITEIKVYVDRFLNFAQSNQDLTFLVTRIGCGLAKYKDKDIAPLFKGAKDIKNIHLPKKFWRYIL